MSQIEAKLKDGISAKDETKGKKLAKAKDEAQSKIKDKKRKRKVSKEKKNASIILPDKPYYEKVLIELNHELSRLRTRITRQDVKTRAIQQELHEIKEDHNDVAEHVKRVLVVRNESIKELQESIIQITKNIEIETVEAVEKKKELEAKFKELQNYLASELSFHKGCLSSLEEYRLERDVMLAKFDGVEDLEQEITQGHDELINSIEQEAIFLKNTLKGQIDGKIKRVWKDGMRSCAIRRSFFTRELIHENIKLHKEIDKLVQSELEVYRHFFYCLQEQKKTDDALMIKEELERQLELNGKNQAQIIESLIINYEKLKSDKMELRKYTQTYKFTKKHNDAQRVAKDDLLDAIAKLEYKNQRMKAEVKIAVVNEKETEAEVIRLKTLAHKIIDTIQHDIAVSDVPDGENQSEKAIDVRRLARKELMVQLLDMLSKPTQKVPYMDPAAKEFYEKGQLGIIPQRSISCEQYHLKKSKSLKSKTYKHGKKITKKAEECATLFKSECGFPISSSHEVFEEIDFEEEEIIEEEHSEAETYDSLPQSPMELTPQPSPLDPSIWKICGTPISDDDYEADVED